MTKNNSYNQLILYLLIFFLIVSPFLIYKYVDSFRSNQELWLKLLSTFIFFLILVYLFSNHKVELSRDEISVLLFVFLIFILSSILFSTSYILSLRYFFLFFCFLFLFFLMVNLKVENKIEIITNCFIISALFISGYTILHYYGLVKIFAEYGPIFSPIGQKNWTSNFLALVLPSCLVFYLLEKKRIRKKFYFITIIIIYTVILICQSRGIWISILLTIPFALILLKKGNIYNLVKENKRNLISLLLIMVVITVIYSTDNPLNRSYLTVPQRAFSVFDREDTSINMRLIMLHSSLKMIQTRPLLGFGLGTFKLCYPDFQGDYLQEKPGMIKYLSEQNVEEAHNEYVQMGSEIGVIGLVLFLFILLYFYKKSWEFITTESTDITDITDNTDIRKYKTIYSGIFLGINIYLLHCLFTFPYHVPFLGASFFMIFGLAVSILLRDGKQLNNKKIYLKIPLRKPLATVGIVGISIIFIIFSYLYIILPYLAEVYSFKGQKAFVIERDFYESIEQFEKASWMDPYNGRILLHLGTMYVNTDDYQQALVILKKTEGLYREKNLFRNIGLCYLNENNLSKAEEYFQKAIYCYPNFINAYHSLASMYIQQEEYQKAIEQWERAIKLNNSFKEKHIFLYFIGMAQQRMGESEQAYNYFLKALIEAPDDSPIMTDIEQELLNIYHGTVS